MDNGSRRDICREANECSIESMTGHFYVKESDRKVDLYVRCKSLPSAKILVEESGTGMRGDTILNCVDRPED